MPQGPAALHKKWKHDGNALKHLGENFVVQSNGVIQRFDQDYILTKEDESAINYLILEWDYWYSGGPVFKVPLNPDPNI